MYVCLYESINKQKSCLLITPRWYTLLILWLDFTYEKNNRDKRTSNVKTTLLPVIGLIVQVSTFPRGRNSQCLLFMYHGPLKPVVFWKWPLYYWLNVRVLRLLQLIYKTLPYSQGPSSLRYTFLRDPVLLVLFILLDFLTVTLTSSLQFPLVYLVWPHPSSSLSYHNLLHYSTKLVRGMWLLFCCKWVNKKYPVVNKLVQNCTFRNPVSLYQKRVFRTTSHSLNSVIS